MSTPEIARRFFANAAGAAVGMVLIAGLNLLLGSTWGEQAEAVPGYLGTVLVVAVLFTAYEVWKRRRAET